MFQKKKRISIGLIAFVVFFMLGSSSASAVVPAFPGAQGGGAISAGGRGGVVIQVTNLLDSGAGSLRACIAATMPRICVFTVGGTIEVLSYLQISNPYITIAGQTAPGGGILLSSKGHIVSGTLITSTHDIVLQYLRIRPGYTSQCGTNQQCGAALHMNSGSHKVVVDHVSVSWNQDEGIGVWDATSYKDRVQNITLSNNLIAEGLLGHSTGMLTGGEETLIMNMTNVDIHHNLTMNNSHRNPFLMGKSSRLVSNIWYNNSFYLNHVGGGVNVDIINNKYKPGPMTNLNTHEVQLFSWDDVIDHTDTHALPGNPSAYMLGNAGYHTGAQWNLVAHVAGENGAEIGAASTTWSRSTPLAALAYPITADAASSLDTVVVPHVGASRKLACDGTWVSNRDSVDTRLINQYTTDTGITVIPATETAVGGFPTIANGTACTDDDEDGMPNVWEIANGLNPNNIADGSTFATNNYTNLENYLNGASSTPDTTPPTIAQVTPVSSISRDSTPNYTFSSTEVGTISYTNCPSPTTVATSGNNTIMLNTLSRGTHSNCSLIVTDASGNPSSSLSLNSFIITYASDLNQDRSVDVLDFGLLHTNYGTTNAAGDVNYDGNVDVLDFGVLHTEYGGSV